MADNDLMNKLVTDAPSAKLKNLSERLASDPRLLAKLVDDPAAAFKDFGITAGADVKLGNREKAMIKMFSDPDVIDLYNAGKIDRLREHILDKYREIAIVNPGDLRSVAVADFDVAIEVEAVAVAVAVVAVVVAGAMEKASRFAILEADNGILSAKIAALEARINMIDKLEAKVNRLEGRIR